MSGHAIGLPTSADRMAVAVLASLALDRRAHLPRLRPRLGRLHPLAIRRPAAQALRLGLPRHPRAVLRQSLLYGGGFDMAAALLAKVLPFDLFETRRLVGAAVGIVGLAVTWRIGRRVGGPLAGLAGAGAARDLPALLRPHVHQCEGRAVRRGDGGVPARRGARVRTISEPECAHHGAVPAGFRPRVRLARARRARRACRDCSRLPS